MTGLTKLPEYASLGKSGLLHMKDKRLGANEVITVIRKME